MDADDLRRLAGRTGFDVATLEKDYALTWLIHGVYSNHFLADSLIFKGGTAIRKIFAPEWRLSEDLDFTVLDRVDPERIHKEFDSFFEALEKRSVFRFAFAQFHARPYYIQARIQFDGPFDHKNKVKLDISLTEKLVTDPIRVKKEEEYDVPPCTVLTYSLQEILVEKLRSILQRSYSRDYYDAWRLLQNREFDDRQIGAFLRQKCEMTGVPFDPGAMFDPERLAGAAMHWEPALGRLTPDLPPFNLVVADLKRRLESIL